MNQLVDKPTHIQGNILDLVLTNAEHLVYSLSVDTSNPLIHSDHYAITFEVCTSLKLREERVGLQYTYNFAKGNYIEMCAYLLDTDFSYLNPLDVELSWLAIKNTILCAIDLFVPKTKIAIHNTQPVWFNNTIRHQIKCLRTLRRKTKQRLNLDKLKRFQEAEDKLQRSIITARVNFENKLINNFSK